MNKKITLQTKDNVLVLTVNVFDTDISVDELTRIDHHNIIGELITSPVLLNQTANLLADFDEQFKISKLDNEILEANLWERFSNELIKEESDAKGNVKSKNPTVKDIENAIKRSKEYRESHIKLIKLEKSLDYVKSLYNSIKDKSRKVEVISSKISPNEFNLDILEGKINNVLVQKKNKLV